MTLHEIVQTLIRAGHRDVIMSDGGTDWTVGGIADYAWDGCDAGCVCDLHDDDWSYGHTQRGLIIYHGSQNMPPAWGERT